MIDPVLAVQNLEVIYHTQVGPLKALHDVNIEIQHGDIVGIVGESGCGKSTIARSILHLLPPNGEISAGQVRFRGEDLLELDEAEWHWFYRFGK